MKTFYAHEHQGHAPALEFEQGRMAPAVEIPARAEAVRARIEARKLGPILRQQAFDDAMIRRVHDGAFIDFLTGAHAAWAARYGSGTEAITGTANPFAAAKASRAAMSPAEMDASAPLSPCPKFPASALKSLPFTDEP